MPEQREPGLVAVIEDDEMQRCAIARVLEAGGFASQLFDSAERFIAAPPARAPLCLIVDVQLPGISGLDLQRHLYFQGSTVPVVVITGNRADVIREQATQAGCAAFLWKPFSADAILAVLASLAKPQSHT